MFTSLVSFFAVAIIPDSERPKYFENLISGLAMSFVGPEWLRLLFQGFVVVVGFLMLSGAVNTAILGSNGVLNRVSEDGVLTPWFRAPHRKFGTTYRTINLIAILQIITIVASRGDTIVLGEAYAFGVIWSFTFNAVATVVLRFRRPEEREWKVPGNIRIGKVEIPMGLITIALILLAIALDKPANQAGGDDIGDSVYGGILCDVHCVRANQPAQARSHRLQTRSVPVATQ